MEQVNFKVHLDKGEARNASPIKSSSNVNLGKVALDLTLNLSSSLQSVWEWCLTLVQSYGSLLFLPKSTKNKGLAISQEGWVLWLSPTRTLLKSEGVFTLESSNMQPFAERVTQTQQNSLSWLQTWWMESRTQAAEGARLPAGTT